MRLDKPYREWLVTEFGRAKALERYCEGEAHKSESRKFDYIWNASRAQILRQSVYESLGYCEASSELIREMEEAAEIELPEVEEDFRRRGLARLGGE